MSYSAQVTFLVGVLSAIGWGVPARASEVEHWSCVNNRLSPSEVVRWTLVENRMFAEKGRGSLTLDSNSPTLAVAHILHTADNKSVVVSYVYILDKIAGRMIEYDDSNAAIFRGKFGQPFEPSITTGACKRDVK